MQRYHHKPSKYLNREYRYTRAMSCRVSRFDSRHTRFCRGTKRNYCRVATHSESSRPIKRTPVFYGILMRLFKLKGLFLLLIHSQLLVPSLFPLILLILIRIDRFFSSLEAEIQNKLSTKKTFFLCWMYILNERTSIINQKYIGSTSCVLSIYGKYSSTNTQINVFTLPLVRYLLFVVIALAGCINSRYFEKLILITGSELYIPQGYRQETWLQDGECFIFLNLSSLYVIIIDYL